MSVTSDGIVSGEFSEILTDMGRTVSYSVVTKTVDAMTGHETDTYADAANQTVIFFLEENRWIWDKTGFLEVGDAYIIAPTSLGIKKYDKFTIDSTGFIISNVVRRHVLGTSMCDYAVCMKIS